MPRKPKVTRRGKNEGSVPLDGLTSLKVQTFLHQLQAEKHLSQRTISLIRGTLIQMYDYAIEMGLARNNPARNAKLPRQPRRAGEGTGKAISITQREAILNAEESNPIMCPAITMLMFTGMRVGEMLALQWKHIDFQAKTIAIRQSVTRELTFDDEGKTATMTDALGATKTRTSQRVLQVPDIGRSVIIGFQESQSYQRFAGRQQEVLSIIIKKQKANLNILPYLVRSSVLLLRHNS